MKKFPIILILFISGCTLNKNYYTEPTISSIATIIGSEHMTERNFLGQYNTGERYIIRAIDGKRINYGFTDNPIKKEIKLTTGKHKILVTANCYSLGRGSFYASALIPLNVKNNLKYIIHGKVTDGGFKDKFIDFWINNLETNETINKPIRANFKMPITVY